MKYLILSLAIFFTQNIFAYQTSDSLYVYAKSGLKLRSEPNLNSETLALARYSEAVKPIRVIDAFYRRIENRTGKWLEVNYQGQTGYMFSSFLSKLPRGKSFDNYRKEGLDWLICQYFDKVLFQTSKKDTLVLNRCEKDPDCKNEMYKISYKMNLGFRTNEYYAYEDYTEEIIGTWLFEDAIDLVESILGLSLVNKFKIERKDGSIQYIEDGPALYSTITVKKVNEFQTSVSYGSGP